MIRDIPEDDTYAQMQDRLASSLLEVGTASYEGDVDKQGLYTCPSATFTARSGVRFEGRLVNGYMHGKGKLTFPAAHSSYEGFFDRNQLTGQGVLSYEGAEYCGGVRGGLHHGQGTCRIKGEPVLYSGDWHMGRRHGRGKLWLNEAKTHAYEGQWRDDMKHGWGVMQFASGNHYEGEWVRDRKRGFGTMYWTDRQERYRGFWENNRQEGVGEHTWFNSVQPTVANHAALLRFNRYVGMFSKGCRHGEGTMLYSSGARYEGEWQADRKQGQGIYVFEDGSCWAGLWEHDAPVVSSTSQPFQPESNKPKLYVSDLLQDEPDAHVAEKGITTILMTYNTELRTLYDLYCTKDVLWLHSGAYSRAADQRPCFGLLSLQVWQMMRDANLLESTFTMSQLNVLLHRACSPPSEVLARRDAVSQTDNAAGVWTMKTPLHSPFLEIQYPEFCEALLRVANARFRSAPGLHRRMHMLVTGRLLPLLGRPRSALTQQLLRSPEFVQYIQTIDPVMRIVFAVAAKKVELEALEQDDARCERGRPQEGPKVLVCATRRAGIAIPLSDEDATIRALPSLPPNLRTHALDVVPKDAVDFAVLSGKQMLALLKLCGVIKAAEGLSVTHALRLLHLGCFPDDSELHPDMILGNGRDAADASHHVGMLLSEVPEPKAADIFSSEFDMTYSDFVAALVVLAIACVPGDKDPLGKFRVLVDGPRGLMAETLRAGHAQLPSELSSQFSYLVQAVGPRGSAKSQARSRGNSRRSLGGGSAAGSVAGSTVGSAAGSEKGDSDVEADPAGDFAEQLG